MSASSEPAGNAGTGSPAMTPPAPEAVTDAGDAVTVETVAEVTLAADLHARPAGRLAQVVAGLPATVRLEYHGRPADPRAILSVLALGARAGTTITVRAEGPEAVRAVETVTRLLTEID
ncbi:HPr family phosphocarrier protein [Thermostaphylospora chromogena]|uniref:Phosphotransferase system HPr (HPr) family n=1 Tax=Thermostaphylospora chromogena TaxID=35622 RepID=A0A1H1D914_9ACTN|nr:HPr family phosphocarrier protein [Thermostaphylospora chromogena]SDQ72678.1 phosphotransferase system HPr (HPr) family [Thermostaphylospora chromogena]